MKNKIKLIVAFFTVVLALSSCLKDTVGDYWVDDLAGKSYATVVNYTKQTLALKPVPGEVNFQFLVNIATDELPTEDITLTFQVDPAAVANYNTNNKTSYKVYPSVALVTQTLVIAKGTRNGYAKAKVWGAEVLDACDNYMTAISIVSAKTTSGKDITIAGNMKSYLLALPIANPYAATYHSSGVFAHPTAGNRDIDEDKEVATIDCKTVTFSCGDLGGDPTTWVILTINADYSVTFGGGLSGSQPYIPVTGKVNKYDPATKTFVLNYYYVGGSGNRVIQENLVRK